MDWRTVDRGLLEWTYGLGLPGTPVEVVTHVATRGGVWLLAALLLAAFGRGLTRRTGAALLAGLVLHVLLLETALKSVVQRPRPCIALGIPLRDGIVDPATYSFPSGHSAASFLAAWVLGARFPRLRLPLLALAGLVAASRVALGAHYPTDVAAGAVLGSVLGIALARTFGLRPDDDLRPAVAGTAGDGGAAAS